MMDSSLGLGLVRISVRVGVGVSISVLWWSSTQNLKTFLVGWTQILFSVLKWPDRHLVIHLIGDDIFY